MKVAEEEGGDCWLRMLLKHIHGTSMGDDGQMVAVVREKILADNVMLNYLKNILFGHMLYYLIKKKLILFYSLICISNRETFLVNYATYVRIV